jgi:enamine deaminase RidA (YjgF/YER057c/UK114 family)
MTNEEMAAQYGFAPAVRAGGLVFFSGVVGYDQDGVAPADPPTQYRLAFAALGDALAGQGCKPADLVDLTTFHAQFPSHMDEFMAVKAEFLAGATPAWTAIGASALGTPETLVEIKAVASVA